MEEAYEQFEEIPPVADFGVICLPNVVVHLPNISDTNMSEVGDDPAAADVPPVFDGPPADDAPPARTDFMPEQYKDISSLEVVKDILGVDPKPFRTIPPEESKNPFDCDRDIDLECTAHALLKEGKNGKMPVYSSVRIREETISKLIKKGDGRRERKKAVASNTGHGLFDELLPEVEKEPEHSVDESEDLDFEPTSQHLESADDYADLVAEGPPPSKQTKRKLNVDNAEVTKPSLSKKGKKQRVSTPATSINKGQG